LLDIFNVFAPPFMIFRLPFMSVESARVKFALGLSVTLFRSLPALINVVFDENNAVPALLRFVRFVKLTDVPSNVTN